MAPQTPPLSSGAFDDIEAEATINNSNDSALCEDVTDRYICKMIPPAVRMESENNYESEAEFPLSTVNCYLIL